VSDFVIPIREDDLQEYRENTPDDADWDMTAGQKRFYERSGRWGSWRVSSVSPKTLFGAQEKHYHWEELGVTSGLDSGPIQLNDGGKVVFQESRDKETDN